VPQRGDRGELVGDAVDRIGSDGVVTVEEARATETSVDVVEGSVSSAAISRPTS
jgi:chaperonin GroEL (HSP60 family)